MVHTANTAVTVTLLFTMSYFSEQPRAYYTCCSGGLTGVGVAVSLIGAGHPLDVLDIPYLLGKTKFLSLYCFA